jgi:3',5'-cyclic AMP phosphodiesterase CpdA
MIPNINQIDFSRHQVILTPEQNDSNLNTLKSGTGGTTQQNKDTLIATVIALSGSEATLELNGLRVVVETHIPLNVGDKLSLKPQLAQDGIIRLSLQSVESNVLPNPIVSDLDLTLILESWGVKTTPRDLFIAKALVTRDGTLNENSFKALKNQLAALPALDQQLASAGAILEKLALPVRESLLPLGLYKTIPQTSNPANKPIALPAEHLQKLLTQTPLLSSPNTSPELARHLKTVLSLLQDLSAEPQVDKQLSNWVKHLTPGVTSSQASQTHTKVIENYHLSDNSVAMPELVADFLKTVEQKQEAANSFLKAVGVVQPDDQPQDKLTALTTIKPDVKPPDVKPIDLKPIEIFIKDLLINYHKQTMPTTNPLGQILKDIRDVKDIRAEEPDGDNPPLSFGESKPKNLDKSVEVRAFKIPEPPTPKTQEQTTVIKQDPLAQTTLKLPQALEKLAELLKQLPPTPQTKDLSDGIKQTLLELRHIQLDNQTNPNSAVQSFNIPLWVPSLKQTLDHNPYVNLKVMRRKKGQTDYDPDNIRIQISLDTINLGLVEADLALKQKSLEIQLRLPSQESVDFIAPHLDELATIINQLGYDVAKLKSQVRQTALQPLSTPVDTQQSLAHFDKRI